MAELNSTGFNLPDRGELLVSFAYDAAGEKGSRIVAAEVQRVRREDGSLASDDLRDYRKPKDGPLYPLSLILFRDSIALGAWARFGFALFKRGEAARQAEAVCRSEGMDAAVIWALSNSTKDRLHVDVLRSMLAHYQNSDNADLVYGLLVKSLVKWR